MDRKSTGVHSRLSNGELDELYRRRLRAGQNINRNDPTRFRVVHNRSVGIPNDSSLPFNTFNIGDSRTSKINPTPRQNPMVDLSSTQQRAMANLGLVTPPVDVQSTHRSFYQGTVGTINAPTILPNQQSRVAASYPMYPPTVHISTQGTEGTINAPTTLPYQQSRVAANYPIYPPTVHISTQGTEGTINAPTTLPYQQSRVAASYPIYPPTQRTSQDNLRPLFDYSPDQVNWSTYVPFIRNKPNVVGPIIPPRYWRTPVYNPINNEETGLYHEMEGVYRHFNTNSVNYYKYANRNNNGDQNDNNNNKENNIL